MAGFGIRTKPIEARATDVPSMRDLPFQDKLMALGMILQGDSASAMQIPMLAAARKRQADEAEWRRGFAEELQGVPMRREVPVLAPDGTDVSAAFSPQEEVVRGPRPTLRDLVPRLLEGRRRGYDIKDELELLKATDPVYKYEAGVRYDERDPSAPREIFKVGEGQRRVYDENGRAIGVMNAEGYVQSVADLERAKTRATEEEKAALDIVRLPTEDGSEVPMTRRQAAGSLAGIPMLGGSTVQGQGGRPGPAPAFRTQTPAEKVLAEGRAKTQVEVEALTPKARSTLDTLDRKTNFVLDALRKARGQVAGGLGGSAGLNALAAGIPETAAYDLRSTIDTIEAAVGFDELQQMRDNSPTGGAVGNLTERELSLLASLRGSLKQGQSPEQLEANITRMIGEIEKVRNERKAAFQRQYGGRREGAPRASTGGGRITAEQARAELERRRAARGGQ